MAKPLVAVSTDVREFDGYTWHCTPDQYLRAVLSAAAVLPVMVPSLGAMIEPDALFGAVDGLLLTGARSNVDPRLYGGEATPGNGPYDPGRDATTMPLIRAAVASGVPLLAICRGIQELNVALGGSLAAEIHERPGAFDHRGPASEDPDERFAIRQTVSVKPGSCLADVLGAGDIRVNSVHRQGIDSLSHALQVEALAADGTVEAVSVKNARAFAVGVQWHPEYWAESDTASGRIFRAFGDAVRERAARRAAPAPLSATA